jgi:hypothetical protein
MTQSAVFRSTTSCDDIQWPLAPTPARKQSNGRAKFRTLHYLRRSAICLLFCSVPALAQSQPIKLVDAPLPDAPGATVQGGQDRNESLGTISGTVVDQNGNFVVSAEVKLAREGQSGQQQVSSNSEGQFVFNGIPEGPFLLTVSAPSFATRQQPGVLHPGELLEMAPISLTVAAAITEVQVSVSNYEIAEEQIKVEETQRVLGVIPNFYVSYQPDALPLSPKQKFELAWKTSVDPVTFAASGAIAGVEQAQNAYSGYGQGAKGYARRFGASYGDALIGVMIGGAILPSLFKQDPRYFYKGTGSTRSRILYALANAVICKGDNGRWQADYSGILGALAAGGISNLYYPASDRNGVGLTFENTLIGIGGSGIANLFQEFLVRKLTPHAQGKP